MESLTPETAIQYLHAMNYAKINDDEHNMAISVGGFTYGVSPVELAAGYATLEIMEPTEILHVYQELPIQEEKI